MKGKREKCCEVMSDLHNSSSSAECRIGSRRAGAMGMVPGETDHQKPIPPAQGDRWSAEGSSSPSTKDSGGHRLERVGQPDGGTRGEVSNALQENARNIFDSPANPLPYPASSTCSPRPVSDCTVAGGSNGLAQMCTDVVLHHDSTAHNDHARPFDTTNRRLRAIIEDEDHDKRLHETMNGRYYSSNKVNA